MRNPKIIEADDFDPKKIYDDLIESCKQVQIWEIRCILEESWVGIAPFRMTIEDGVFTCFVVAKTKRDAYIEVANKLPVIKFLSRQDDE
jgi:hypothetical protein